MELIGNVLFIYCLPTRDCANFLGLPTNTNILQPPSKGSPLIRKDTKGVCFFFSFSFVCVAHVGFGGGGVYPTKKAKEISTSGSDSKSSSTSPSSLNHKL
jgi:hypothetical protein